MCERLKRRLVVSALAPKSPCDVPNMRAKLMTEVAALGLPDGSAHQTLVTDADLANLPEPAQRYLRFMGVVGRPRDWSFQLGYTGRFRRAQNGAWMRCEAWQYNNGLAVARIFHIRIRIGGIVPVLARDSYVAGHGRVLIRLLDFFPVGDGTGEEFDTGELVTYLNDGVFIAPAMLLVPEVKWSPVDATWFNIALTDHGHAVAATVFIDQRGAPTNFSTTDRFCYDPNNPKRLVRARWTTPVEGWRDVAGRRLWERGQAIWHLANGDFAYVDFSPVSSSFSFNLMPNA